MSTADTTSSVNLEERPKSPEGEAAPKVPGEATSKVPGGAASKAPSVSKGRSRKRRGLDWLIVVAFVLAGGGGAGWYFWQQYLNALPPYIASANGRLEAEQVEIATKFQGRIDVVLAKEGDMVKAGQVLARMDTVELEAQKRTAQAQVDRYQHEKIMAEALIAQRESERIFAAQELERSATLAPKGWSTREQLDQRRSQMRVAEAAVATAVAARDAADANILSEQAEVVRLQHQIDDSTLVAPTTGRIQYKLAQPGEVLPAGGRVLTMLDLTDIYLTIFVPAHVAGRLANGDEARVTLDPDPVSVFPARISFVATEAQFTPKTVETAEGREKLMFRVKLSAPPELLTRYMNIIHTGVRGIGFVRTDPNAPWPDKLNVKLP
jgi:HlyD family secretion protein